MIDTADLRLNLNLAERGCFLEQMTNNIARRARDEFVSAGIELGIGAAGVAGLGITVAGALAKNIDVVTIGLPLSVGSVAFRPAARDLRDAIGHQRKAGSLREVTQAEMSRSLLENIPIDIVDQTLFKQISNKLSRDTDLVESALRALGMQVEPSNVNKIEETSNVLFFPVEDLDQRNDLEFTMISGHGGPYLDDFLPQRVVNGLGKDDRIVWVSSFIPHKLDPKENAPSECTNEIIHYETAGKPFEVKLPTDKGGQNATAFVSPRALVVVENGLNNTCLIGLGRDLTRQLWNLTMPDIAYPGTH